MGFAHKHSTPDITAPTVSLLGKIIIAEVYRGYIRIEYERELQRWSKVIPFSFLVNLRSTPIDTTNLSRSLLLKDLKIKYVSSISETLTLEPLLNNENNFLIISKDPSQFYWQFKTDCQIDESYFMSDIFSNVCSGLQPARMLLLCCCPQESVYGVYGRIYTVLSGNKVISINNISSKKPEELMKKLNQKKIRWIIKEITKRDEGVYTIAKKQNITFQHAYRVYRKYKNVKEPRLLPCGRKPKPISEQEKQIVIKTFKEFRVGATMIEQILDEKGIHINHNRIHKILLEEGLAREEHKKKKTRKWVRYERKHSLSLVHSDWFEFKGWKIMLIEDDASRFITGFGKFKHATTENAIKVFMRSLGHGKPKQFHSDNGSVFRANEQEGKKQGESEFSKLLKEYEVQQIFARVKRPQANGKMERVIATIKRLWNELGSLERAVKHYNYKRPHRSLTNGKLRTPYQAFLEKARKA